MIFKRILVTTLALALLSCAAQRQPIPVGEIPIQSELTQQEVQYGSQVYNQIARQYKEDTNLENSRRVRKIVSRLSDAVAGSSGGNPWHVYIFKDDNFRNAAATRGNYIFVWTGIINAAKSDHELATVLAHEVSHVLAKHTTKTTGETVNDILVGVTGEATKMAVHNSGYSGGAALAGQLAAMLMKSLIVNPQSQRLEMEADTIGIFLMAKAGYNPQAAIDFWRTIKDDPSSSAADSMPFLSSHPTSTERLKNLEKLLPEAKEIYRRNR